MFDQEGLIKVGIMISGYYSSTKIGTGLPGFEPGFRAPEAPVLSWLDYRPN